METLFDAGRRHASSQGALASYDATVAGYRETTLTALQQVEDNLAALRILEQEQPQYLAVAFDVGKTFRDNIFPEYKGTREKMPDEGVR